MPQSQKPLLIVTCIAAAANSITMGYDTMMMSSLIAIPQFTNYFNLNPTINGLMNASLWIGNILACPFMQIMADRLGRKMTVLLACSLNFVGVALQTASTTNIGMFIFARIVLGFCTELAGAASPLMVAETAPKSIRGFMVGMYFTCFNIGAIIATGITYGTENIGSTWAWRLPSLLQGVPSAMAIILLFFVPESPRWLTLKGEFQKAVKVLKISNNIDEDKAEAMVDEINFDIQEEKQDTRGAWHTLIRPSRPNQRRLIMVVSLGLIAELSGTIVGTYYLTVILQQAGITGEKKLLQINLISACWNFISAVCGALSFDYLGRRKQAIVCVTGMIVSFALLGAFVKIYGNSTNRSGQYATIFFMFLFNGFYNFCVTPLNCLYPSELFPMKTRAAGATVFKFTNCASGIVGTFVFPIAMDNLGWKFYVINAGYNVVFLLIVIFFWVETKGLSLEEIGRSLGEEPQVISAPDSDSVRVIHEVHEPKK